MIFDVDPNHKGKISFDTFQKILMDGNVESNLDVKD